MIKKLIEIITEKRTEPHRQYIEIIDKKLIQCKDELDCIVNALEKEKRYMSQYLYQPTTEQIEKIEAEIRDNILLSENHPLHKDIIDVINELNDPYGNEKDDNGNSAVDIAIMDNQAIRVIGNIISTFWLLQFDFIKINRNADRQRFLYAIDTIQGIDKSIDFTDQIISTGSITEEKIMRSCFFSITRSLKFITDEKKAEIANLILWSIFDYDAQKFRITDKIKNTDYLDLNTLYYYA
jgi:site-specific DNA-adenine methylase